MARVGLEAALSAPVRIFARSIPLFIAAAAMALPVFVAQTEKFHNAPASARQMTNPVAGQVAAISAGRRLYAARCSECHGKNAQGTGNVPDVTTGPTQSAAPGEVFWYITHGDARNGMPAWFILPVRQRWQIVSYLKSLPNAKPGNRAAAASSASSNRTAVMASTDRRPLPRAPFVDYRLQEPGRVRKISVEDLPRPFATSSASNGPDLV